MEPPHKRRCLSDSTYAESDASIDLQDELSTDPVEAPASPDHEHELTLKRAEVGRRMEAAMQSIFERYSQDFDGVGDEIDMLTGEIVVDNGHLAGLRRRRPLSKGSSKTHRRRMGALGLGGRGWDEVDDPNHGLNHASDRDDKEGNHHRCQLAFKPQAGLHDHAPQLIASSPARVPSGSAPGPRAVPGYDTGIVSSPLQGHLIVPASSCRICTDDRAINNPRRGTLFSASPHTKQSGKPVLASGITTGLSNDPDLARRKRPRGRPRKYGPEATRVSGHLSEKENSGSHGLKMVHSPLHKDVVPARQREHEDDDALFWDSWLSAIRSQDASLTAKQEPVAPNGDEEPAHSRRRSGRSRKPPSYFGKTSWVEALESLRSWSSKPPKLPNLLGNLNQNEENQFEGSLEQPAALAQPHQQTKPSQGEARRPLLISAIVPDSQDSSGPLESVGASQQKQPSPSRSRSERWQDYDELLSLSDEEAPVILPGLAGSKWLVWPQQMRKIQDRPSNEWDAQAPAVKRKRGRPRKAPVSERSPGGGGVLKVSCKRPAAGEAAAGATAGTGITVPSDSQVVEIINSQETGVPFSSLENSDLPSFQLALTSRAGSHGRRLSVGPADANAPAFDLDVSLDVDAVNPVHQDKETQSQAEPAECVQEQDHLQASAPLQSSRESRDLRLTRGNVSQASTETNSSAEGNGEWLDERSSPSGLDSYLDLTEVLSSSKRSSRHFELDVVLASPDLHDLTSTAQGHAAFLPFSELEARAARSRTESAHSCAQTTSKASPRPSTSTITNPHTSSSSTPSKPIPRHPSASSPRRTASTTSSPRPQPRSGTPRPSRRSVLSLLSSGRNRTPASARRNKGEKKHGTDVHHPHDNGRDNDGDEEDDADELGRADDSVMSFFSSRASAVAKSSRTSSATRKIWKSSVLTTEIFHTPVKRRGEDPESTVRTPGGTLRTCGVDDYRCGRDFCFTCL